MRTALLNRFIMSVYLTDQSLVTYFTADSKTYFNWYCRGGGWFGKRGSDSPAPCWWRNDNNFQNFIELNRFLVKVMWMNLQRMFFYFSEQAHPAVKPYHPSQRD